MRLSFLTPRLPPAVCGLADHTKLLARAMVNQGVDVGFIHREPFEQDGELPPGPVDHWNEGITSLEECVTRQDPDWLWVQLSSYGYSRWGAPYRLGRELARLRQNRLDLRLAICVHETHCRPEQLGLKGPLLSPWQRHAVGMVVRLGDMVFPTIRPYCEQVIRDYKVPPDKVVRIPIGSNIPCVRFTASDRALARRKLGWEDHEITAVTFGTFGSQLRALELFENLIAKGMEQHHLNRVVCLGGEGPKIPPELVAWATRFLRLGSFQVLGPQPAQTIGEILACCDFGLPRTPRPFLEKSGAFMALAAAGLAVLVSNAPSKGAPANDDLLVLSAESWDWQEARSPYITMLRRALREHAQAHYSWDAIARRALAHMRSV